MKKRAPKARSFFSGAFCYFCYAGRRLLRRGKLLCRNGFRSDGTGLAAPAAHFKLCGKAFAISVGCASKTARCPRSAVHSKRLRRISADLVEKMPAVSSVGYASKATRSPRPILPKSKCGAPGRLRTKSYPRATARGSVCKFSCLSGRDLPTSCLVRPYVAARSCLQVIGCHRSQPFSRSPTRFSRKLTGIGPCDRFVRTRCPASDGGLVRSEEFSASYSIAGALPIAEEHLLPRMPLSRFISPPLGWNCTLDYPPSTKSSSLGK